MNTASNLALQDGHHMTQSTSCETTSGLSQSDCVADILKPSKKGQQARATAHATLSFDAGLDAISDLAAPSPAPTPGLNGMQGSGVGRHAPAPAPSSTTSKRLCLISLHLNPSIPAQGPRSGELPAPECLYKSKKKTIFVNLPDIAGWMKRDGEHITSFLFAELGTSGRVDELGREYLPHLSRPSAGC
jgi:translation initiation factor 2 subunit 2